MSDFEELTRLTLEKVEIGAQMNISYAAAQHMKAEVLSDAAARQLVAAVTAYMWGNQIHREVTGHVEYPASWWQGFKQSFFPDWLKRHYPVRYERKETSVKFVHTCPHLRIETRDDERVHLQYLADSSLLRRWETFAR